MYTEAQGLVEVDLSAILDPFGSNQFMSCSRAMPFFQRLCPAPFPPVSDPLKGYWGLSGVLGPQFENCWHVDMRVFINDTFTSFWQQNNIRMETLPNICFQNALNVFSLKTNKQTNKTSF